MFVEVLHIFFFIWLGTSLDRFNVMRFAQLSNVLEHACRRRLCGLRKWMSFHALDMVTGGVNEAQRGFIKVSQRVHGEPP